QLDDCLLHRDAGTRDARPRRGASWQRSHAGRSAGWDDAGVIVDGFIVCGTARFADWPCNRRRSHGPVGSAINGHPPRKDLCYYLWYWHADGWSNGCSLRDYLSDYDQSRHGLSWESFCGLRYRWVG